MSSKVIQSAPPVAADGGRTPQDPVALLPHDAPRASTARSSDTTGLPGARSTPAPARLPEPSADVLAARENALRRLEGRDSGAMIRHLESAAPSATKPNRESCWSGHSPPRDWGDSSRMAGTSRWSDDSLDIDLGDENGGDGDAEVLQVSRKPADQLKCETRVRGALVPSPSSSQGTSSGSSPATTASLPLTASTPHGAAASMTDRSPKIPHAHQQPLDFAALRARLSQVSAALRARLSQVGAEMEARNRLNDGDAKFGRLDPKAQSAVESGVKGLRRTLRGLFK